MNDDDSDDNEELISRTVDDDDDEMVTSDDDDDSDHIDDNGKTDKYDVDENSSEDFIFSKKVKRKFSFDDSGTNLKFLELENIFSIKILF